MLNNSEKLTSLGHVVVIDDDASVRRSLRSMLERVGYGVHVHESADAFLLNSHAPAPSVILLDMRMPGMTGVGLQTQLQNDLQHVPIIFMSGDSRPDEIITAMKQGAFDFLLKPFEPKALLAHIQKYELPDIGESAGVVAVDPASKALFSMAQRVALTDATVLLTGESGVGKEVVARFIHRQSNRRAGPFVAINTAAAAKPRAI